MAQTPLFDDGMTMLQARTLLFAHYGLGDDGGYNDRWVRLKMGPVPLAIPNTASRVRAVRYHDLHHVLTGYKTDWDGEAQISAWELASGCAGFGAAWWLNFGGMTLGLFMSPRRTFRAFIRGLRSRNLYRETFDDALLARRVGELRAQLRLDALSMDADPLEALTAREVLTFVGYSILSASTQLAALALLFAPLLMLGRSLLTQPF